MPIKNKTTDFELLLAELVHYISYSVDGESGLNFKDVKKFLNAKLSHKNNKTVIQCLYEERQHFLNELRTYMNELDQ